MALKAEVWVGAVTEGGRRFMAAWRRGRRGQTYRQEKRNATRLESVAVAHGRVEFCEATPIGLADESKESWYGRKTDRDLRSADLRSA